MTRLGIVLLTYNRLSYARLTLRSTLAYLEWEGELQVHIASDGDGKDYIEELHDLAVPWPQVKQITVTNSERGGYGKNYNLAMQAVHPACEYSLLLEDDWQLLHTLDATALVKDMQDLSIGCARLGYIGFTQELRATFAAVNGHYWLRFDPASAEPHVFAGHPRIEARDWSRVLGPWPEGLEPGATEFAVAQRPESRKGVGWPLSVVHPRGDLYAHIGTVRSY